MNITEILNAYTTGEANLEDTNAALKKAGAIFHIDPKKNEIAAGERETHGLLDTGTGTMDKVEIKNFRMVNADCGNMVAHCYFNGKKYTVQGDTLFI